MRESVELILAKEEDASLLHQIKYLSFLPLYEKYHDNETSPVKETVEKVIKCIQMERSDYYFLPIHRQSNGDWIPYQREKEIAICTKNAGLYELVCTEN